jgi:exopolysaccharide biosynthesis polyprenyl glycosylphosphotransferase
MFTAVSTGMLVMALCMFSFKITDVSRSMMGIFFLLNIGLLTLSKWTIYWTFSHYRSKGFNLRNILIVGSRDRARDVINAIEKSSSAGYRILGCLEVNGNIDGTQVQNGIRIIGTINRLDEILAERVVDEYISLAEKVGVAVRIVPDWQIHRLMYRPEVARIAFEDFLGVPTMALTTTPPMQAALLFKSAFDYLFAGTALILSLPLFLLISIAIKLFSPGPVFFEQERSGLNGRKFMLYKFRTMVPNAELLRQELEALNEADGPVFKIKKDPRIIPFVGVLLRKTSLDELPQLINVLKGEMSLIGPRPPIPAEVGEYEIWQRRRLSMKPGVTGLWQCAPRRNEISFKDWMNMDLSYIDNWSLWLDFKILFRTFKVVVAGAGR